MDLKLIPAGRNPPKDVNAVIEIPQGGEPVKYEMDKDSGALFVDRFLHTAMFYPGNYGFIPHTLADDGDPMDIIVVGQTPVVPGAIIRARPVACCKSLDAPVDGSPNTSFFAVRPPMSPAIRSRSSLRVRR